MVIRGIEFEVLERLCTENRKDEPDFDRVMIHYNQRGLFDEYCKALRTLKRKGYITFPESIFVYGGDSTKPFEIVYNNIHILRNYP